MDIELARANIAGEDIPIAKRMRALFYLRNILEPASAHAIAEAFGSRSVLLKHEVAYVLGQMRLDESVDILIDVLSNEEEDEIVRHEAGEALGNYSPTERIVEVLTTYSQHPRQPISETCQLALRNLGSSEQMSKFHSRDPAPALLGTFEEARGILLDRDECLFRRYQAMFLLRDLGTPEAVHALGAAMDDDSALFKHEISFVFGQMRNKLSVPYLIKGVCDESEHGMVRHECAEAIGIIGDDTGFRTLLKYLHDPCDILRESVEVAVDFHKYITSDEAEYCGVY